MADGDWLQGTLMGLLIAIGNVIVYNLAYVIAGKAGFHYKDRRDRFYVVLYTVAVFINTCLDLGVVCVMASGSQLDESFKSGDSNQGPPSYRHALYVQLLGYLYPGTLLIPFMLEPIVTVLVPYLLGLGLVRSKPKVFKRVRDAEEM